MFHGGRRGYWGGGGASPCCGSLRVVRSCGLLEGDVVVGLAVGVSGRFVWVAACEAGGFEDVAADEFAGFVVEFGVVERGLQIIVFESVPAL